VGALLAVLVIGVVMVGSALQGPRTATPRPVLVSSGSWAPFVGPDLPDGGPLAALVAEVLHRQGYSPEMSYSSWELAERRATANETIGAFPFIATAARRADMLLSDPLVEFEYVLFYDSRRGVPSVTAAGDLAGYRVGQIAGYDHWPELAAAAPESVVYPTSLAAFRALGRGEIDLLPEGLLSGRALLATPEFAADASDFAHLEDRTPLVRSTQGLHLVMPRTGEGARLMEDFNAGLADYRRTDEYEQTVAELADGGTADPVTLVPWDGEGLVELLDTSGRPALLAPLGTEAQVLQWPAAFTTPGTMPDPPVLVPVKLLNGPAQGRVFSVDARTLRLESE
jgi:ABC-type amino acid transport substrate-binding protein